MGDTGMLDKSVADHLNRESQLRQWIEQILQRPMVSRDLSVCLRDGTVLCHVMLNIQPRSIPIVYNITKESAQHVRTNIEHFLKAVKRYGCPESQCFDIAD